MGIRAKKQAKPKTVSRGRFWDFYEVQGGEEKPYSVVYNIRRDEYSCTCVHGSSGFKGLCWHIRAVQELRGKKK